MPTQYLPEPRTMEAKRHLDKGRCPLCLVLYPKCFCRFCSACDCFWLAMKEHDRDLEQAPDTYGIEREECPECADDTPRA